MNPLALPRNVRTRLTAVLSCGALGLSALLAAPTPAHAAVATAPIIGTAYNSSRLSNCAGSGILGVAYTGVSFNPVGAQRTTHIVSTQESGIFTQINWVENSATKVDELNDCINGDWYYAFAAAYPSAWVHRTILQLLVCNGGGCDEAGVFPSGWTAGWAGPIKP